MAVTSLRTALDASAGIDSMIFVGDSISSCFCFCFDGRGCCRHH